MKLIKQIGKKMMVSMLLFGVLAGGGIDNEVYVANAQGAGGGSSTTATQPAASDTLKDSSVIKNLTEVINVVMVFLAKFLWPIIVMIGALMGNDLLFGGPMEQTLLTIWSGVRDVVHVLFVLSLLFIAILNILGVTQRATMQDYEIKKILPRLVISLIAINFSFLLCKVTLDAVQVVATGIMGLGPVQSQYQNHIANMEGGGVNKVAKIANDYCQAIKDNLSFTNATDNFTTKKNLEQYCKSFDTEKQKIEDYFKQYNVSNAALIMAIDLQSIVDISKVSKGVANLKDLTINALFAVAFFIMYSVAYIALFVALLFRVVVLWIVIALSPLIALGYAVPAVKTRVLEGENDLQKNFLEHAIVPIPVAVVMALGMVMATALKSAEPVNANLDVTTSGAGVLLNGMSNFQDIIVAAATVGFLWMAVFTVTAKGKAEGAVNKIKEFVTGVGGYALQAPLYFPVLPTKSGNVSIGGLSQLVDKPREAINEQMRKDRIALGMEGGRPDEMLQKLKNARGTQALKEALSKFNYDDYERMTAQQKKELAEEIRKRKTEMQRAGIKPPAGYADLDKFAEGLEKGTVNRGQMNEFLNNFKQEIGKDANKKINEADKLLEEAKKNWVKVNDEKYKKLEEAKDALENAKDNPGKLLSAESMFAQAKSELQKLNDERKNFLESAKKSNAIELNRGFGAEKKKEFFNGFGKDNAEREKEMNDYLSKNGVSNQGKRKKIVEAFKKGSDVDFSDNTTGGGNGGGGAGNPQAAVDGTAGGQVNPQGGAGAPPPAPNP